MIDYNKLSEALRGLKPYGGEYITYDKDGNEVCRTKNFLTYAGIDILTSVIAQRITPATWQVGCLSGVSTKDDTNAIHAWTEPTEAQGYSRQTCTIQDVIRTTVSSQTVTALLFTPVTFTCGAENDNWDKAYTNLFCAMTDTQEPAHTEIISIGSQLPSPIRLFKGGSYTNAYRLYFRA